ncbi:uncharacterized protein BXZ73DRAFT_108252 [Epithele typhae]|uniref:uncharacterized protein n=1 Tax=Epithele typhae TaxID=378194 RepID=UPI0020072764|nr:uncharacterized protein BXZ73DRAFT_108252 [Epithele typhae]KAH9911091.1 hypothetical protein BXZ73DRAFT_108252 [Epithele typhae]
MRHGDGPDDVPQTQDTRSVPRCAQVQAQDALARRHEDPDGTMNPAGPNQCAARSPATPASPRRARDACQHLATRVLGNTFILGRTRHSTPMNVRLPPNLVAFFGPFMRLQCVGHLTYWLSEFRARILSGSTARSRSRIASRGTCSRTGWLVNLDIVLATTLTALTALRFSALTTLPAGFARAPTSLCGRRRSNQRAQCTCS